MMIDNMQEYKSVFTVGHEEESRYMNLMKKGGE